MEARNSLPEIQVSIAQSPGAEPGERTGLRRPLSYPHLDFLRSVAVMLVFFGHLMASLGHLYGVGTAAHLGVVVFFVHTCLVLFLSMERLGTDRLFRRFYVRRIARIYPLSIVAVVFILVSRFPPAPWLPWSRPDWPTVASNILLIQNLTGRESMLGPMWSLPFEVQMYAVLPVLFLLYSRGVSARAIWTVAAVFSGVLWMLPSHGFAELCKYVPCFCSGIVAYSMLRLPRAMNFGWLAAALAGALVAEVAAGHWRVPLALADGSIALAIGLVVGRLSILPGFVAHASATIAKYSYGIYLAHLPIMWFCFSGGHGIRRWVLFACLSVLVPVALYHAIERPFIRLGARAFAAPSPTSGGALREASCSP